MGLHKGEVGWLAKGNPGPAACGGVFCNNLGGYGLMIDHQTAYFAVMMALILAKETAYDKGWHNLWLECDSLLVIHLLTDASLYPLWTFHNRWFNCC